jgi:small subunit ribosomal protein S21
MIIVNIEKHGSVEKALKTLKKKFQNTKVVNELRERKQFTKPSVKRRTEINKAIWKESKRTEE